MKNTHMHITVNDITLRFRSTPWGEYSITVKDEMGTLRSVWRGGRRNDGEVIFNYWAAQISRPSPLKENALTALLLTAV